MYEMGGVYSIELLGKIVRFPLTLTMGVSVPIVKFDPRAANRSKYIQKEEEKNIREWDTSIENIEHYRLVEMSIHGNVECSGRVQDSDVDDR